MDINASFSDNNALEKKEWTKDAKIEIKNVDKLQDKANIRITLNNKFYDLEYSKQDIASNYVIIPTNDL